MNVSFPWYIQNWHPQTVIQNGKLYSDRNDIEAPLGLVGVRWMEMGKKIEMGIKCEERVSSLNF